ALERRREGGVDLLQDLVGRLADRLLLGVRRGLQQLLLASADRAVGPAVIGVGLAHGLLRLGAVELLREVAEKLLQIVSQRGHGRNEPPWLRCGLGLLHDLGEGRRITDGEIGEDLAVELDVGALQPAHELRVADAVYARSGVDADDPEGPEVALALTTVPRGVAPGVVDRVDHRLPELAAPSAVALGRLADAIAAAPRLESSFCSSHLSLTLFGRRSGLQNRSFKTLVQTFGNGAYYQTSTCKARAS